MFFAAAVAEIAPVERQARRVTNSPAASASSGFSQRRESYGRFRRAMVTCGTKGRASAATPCRAASFSIFAASFASSPRGSASSMTTTLALLHRGERVQAASARLRACRSGVDERRQRLAERGHGGDGEARP